MGGVGAGGRREGGRNQVMLEGEMEGSQRNVAGRVDGLMGRDGVCWERENVVCGEGRSGGRDGMPRRQ